LRLEEEDYSGDFILAVDVLEIKVVNWGDQIRLRCKVRRGYLRIHIAVDTKGKRIIELQVTDERTVDGRMPELLVEEAPRRLRSSRTSAAPATLKTISATSRARASNLSSRCARVNAGKAGGRMLRKLVVHVYFMDSAAWKQNPGYRYRWMVESAPSSLKRTFGEYVSAWSMGNIGKR
jgi:hypothetical protein